MAVEIDIQNAEKADPSNHTDRSVVSVQRSLLLGFISFLVLAFLTGAVIYQRYINKKQEKKEDALTVANNARVRLQETLAFSLSAAKTLSFFIQDDGSVQHFDSIASEILHSTDHIDALQLVPGGIIKYVYPFKANEKVLGYNILEDSTRNKEALRAIEKNEMFFAGPFELRQGGMGVVGRLPVFRKNKFWGFSAIVIRMPTLLKSAGIDSTGNSGYYYQLSKINPDTKKEEFFIRHSKEHSRLHTLSVFVPNGEWKLSVIPVKPFQGFENIVILAVLGLLFSTLGAMFVYSVSQRPKKLNELVKVRTKQLRESEENYKILFERSPLPLWIYDLETYKFLEVNDAAVKLYGYSREEFLSMDVRAIRREEDVPGFIETAMNNTDELRHSGIRLHIKKNKEEIDVLIFSRNISYKNIQGCLVLAMDVSEKVKIENELIKSEEKYRSLIEQASDGIILYSFDGTIHSFNKAAYTLTGYTEAEFEKLNLKDLFFESVARSRPGDGRVKPARTSILYRKLKRKDGSIFSVELNTHMLPDGKILAIVRDISEREKAEMARKESEEKFSKSFHSNVLGFAIYDDDHRVIDMNETFAHMLESTREKLLGKSSDEAGLINKVNEKSRKIVREKIQEIIQAEGRLQNFEAEIETHTRKKVTLLLSMEKLDLSNKQHWITSAIDITDRKRNEDILRYQARLLDGVSDAITSLDTNRIIVSWNKACEELYGFTTEEVMGKKIPEIVTFEFPNSNPEEVFKQVFSDGQWKGEFNFIHPKIKTKKHLLSSINLLKNKEEEIIGFIITSSDITDRKKAELARAHEEQTRQLIMNSALDAIICINSDGAINLWNPQAEKIFGWSEVEITGRKLSETIIPPQYREQHENGLKRYLQTGEGPVLNRMLEITALSRDGREFPIELSIVPLEQDGELSFCAFIRDITDRKKAEEELRKSNERFELIAEATNDAVWDHDFVKNETWGNAKLYNTYGFEPGTRKIDFEIFLSRIHAEDRSGVENRMQEAIEKSGTFLSEEFRFKTSNDQYRIFYDRAYILYDTEGRPIRLVGAMQDITDKETIKQQILKEKELSDSIINGLPGIFYLYNKEGKFLRWNRNLEKVTGYNAEEVSGMHPLRFYNAEDHPLITAKIANVFVAGDDHVEADLLLKNGESIPYYFTGQAIEYEGEICLMGVGMDLSEKEKAKNAILASETKYKELIEQASDGIFISDQEGNYIDVNSGACRMLGYTQEELLTMGGAEVLYQDKDVNTLPNRYGELKSGKSSILETTLRRKDGTLISVESNSKMLPDGRFIGIVRDLTERKKADKALRESEERYRALVENAPEALVVMDVKKQVFVSVSESATKLFKMTREELLRAGPVDLSPEYQPDGRLSSEAARENIQKAVDGGKPAFEWIHHDKEGKPIPCEIWLVRLPSENDILIRGSIVDITERKKAAEEIKANADLLRELYANSQNIREEERTYIAREIHDELGQQLTGLKMDLSWLNRKLKSSDINIQEKLEGTLNLVDITIKTVRKIATELRPSILDDLGLVAALEWQSEEFGKRSDISVNFTSNLKEEFIEPVISTAFFRIYQELLTNIARHANAKTVNTSITFNNNELRLSVEDDGVGFDPDGILVKKTLGLRGIKERTNLINGTYEIKTKAGKGTFVLISVPLQKTTVHS